MLLLWLIVFIISLFLLIKGADWVLVSSEKIGLALGLSPFIVGVIIVGVGTSFPEIISSLAAVFKGATEIVPANAIGSNIANILLIVGLSAIFGKKLIVTKNLIDIDLPLLAVTTVILLAAVWDKQITFIESLLLLISYIIYLSYTIFHREDEGFEHPKNFLFSRAGKRKIITVKTHKKEDKIIRPKIKSVDIIMLIIGIIFLIVGAKYLIESVVNLSLILNIGVGIITISAVAFGTSLPELIVSIKAAIRKKAEIALGTVFGSNVFNALMVVSIPGLIKTLKVDDQTFQVGIPTLAFATILFIISGISKKIYMWEGAMYLILYIMFIGKLFALF